MTNFKFFMIWVVLAHIAMSLFFISFRFAQIVILLGGAKSPFDLGVK